MNTGMRTALCLGGGYLLGRRRKMRWLVLLAAAGATGRSGGVAGQLLKRGTKLLGSTEALEKVSPALGEIAETVRGELLEAGRAAASAAVSRRVSSLSDSLHDRAEALRNPAAAVGGAEEAVGHRERPGRARGETGDGERPEDRAAGREGAPPEAGDGEAGGRDRARGRAGDGAAEPERAARARGQGRSQMGDGESRGRQRSERQRPSGDGGRSPVRRTGR